MFCIKNYLECKVNNLYETDDWEASEESHSAAHSGQNVGELRSVVHRHPVESRAVEEDPNKTQIVRQLEI